MEYFDYKVIETIKKEMNLTNEKLGLIFDMKAQSVSNKLNRKSKWNIIDLYKLVEYFDDGSEISIKKSQGVIKLHIYLYDRKQRIRMHKCYTISQEEF